MCFNQVFLYGNAIELDQKNKNPLKFGESLISKTRKYGSLIL